MTQHWPPPDPLISPDFNGWWGRSFALLKATWRPMAVIQLIMGVPALAVLMPAMLMFQDQQREAQDKLRAATDAGTQPEVSWFFVGLPVLVSAALVASLFFLVSQLACQQVVVLTATGRTGGLVGPAFRVAARRSPAAIGWWLVAVPLLIVAFALCFLPVLYVGAVLTVLSVVVLLERGNGIGRCFRLFHADLGVSVSRIATIFGLSLGAGLALTLISTLIDVTIGGSFSTPNATATVLNTVLQSIYYFVSYLVLSPLLVTTYADMRARREPFSTADLR